MMKLFAAPSNAEWLLFAALFAAIGIFIVIAEFLRNKYHGSPEITRKLVHILTGMLIFFAPALFISGIPAILLAVVFITVTYSAIKLGLLKGIHGTNRVSYGTVYYPFSFLVLVLLFWDAAPFVISISILILALGDAAAAIVGENLKHPHEYYLTSDKKSYEGSLTMFLSTFGIVQFSVWYFDMSFPLINAVQIGMAVALFTTAWEAISSKGFDNLTVPLGSAFMIYYFFVPHPHHDLQQMFLGVVLGSGIALVSLYLKFLSPSGSIATFLLASTIFGIGSWKWSVPILVFFISSSMLSKYEKSRKAKYEQVFDKTDTRDEGQVAANGGIAGLLVILWFVFMDKTEIFYYYLATIAAVNADTWGTEIGILGKGKPVSIITFEKVEPGTSGGVSLIGMIGGFIGSLLIVFSAVVFDPNALSLVIAAKIVFAGVAGAAIDSVLGASIQSQYLTVDNKLIEKSSYHGTPAKLVKGVRWVDNDVVNWTCAISAPVILALIL